MPEHRILIIGDSLFAETLASMLARAGQVSVVGTTSTPEAAIPLLRKTCLDAVIVAGIGDDLSQDLGHLLAAFPDLPVIRADLNTDSVQVITSQRVSARPSDLLAAIAALPVRR